VRRLNVRAVVAASLLFVAGLFQAAFFALVDAIGEDGGYGVEIAIGVIGAAVAVVLLVCSARPRAARIVGLVGVGVVAVDVIIDLTTGSYSEGLIVLPALPVGGLLAVAAWKGVEPT
jgi:hypothetical protein